MKHIFFSLLILYFLLSCKTHKNVIIADRESVNPYLVEKIDSVNNYYLVYVSCEKKYYKVVSEKSPCNYNIIKVGKSYPSFMFQPLIDEEEYKRRAKAFNVINYLDLTPSCINLDNSTKVCKEVIHDPSGNVTKTKVYGLYKTSNLNGLCYIDLMPRLNK